MRSSKCSPRSRRPASNSSRSAATEQRLQQPLRHLSAQISGKITIDPKLKANVDPNAALFIIARPAGGAGGPPLAVKKIDKPTFPLTYSLSQENVMMQGTPFTGKINITVRLDKDGNPVTRDPRRPDRRLQEKSRLKLEQRTSMW